MTITVIKRDGRKVPFNKDKIYKAIQKACHISNLEPTIQELTDEVVSKITTESITVEDIQDLVEHTLVAHNLFNEAKAYILYRDQRTKARDLKSTLTKTVSDLITVNAKDSDLKRENANIDGNSPMGIMLQFGSEIAKKFSLEAVLRPEQAQAHINGDIHIHDLNFLPICWNCSQIPLSKLLKQGFSTGHGYIREPNSITSAAALACIILQSNQNEMFR